MAPIEIKSTAQFDDILGKNALVVVDFYATWCGPCKAIAPSYNSLSSAHPKTPFLKVDTDANNAIAARYSVRAMPTFKVFVKGVVVETVQGADIKGLTAAVEKGVKLAGKSAGGGFSSGGQRLGGVGVDGPRKVVRNGGGGFLQSLFERLYYMVGLYLVSLFSLDPYESARTSRFNLTSPVPSASAGPTTSFTTGSPSGSAPRPRQTPQSRFKTLADL